jgi:hypothetical protein
MSAVVYIRPIPRHVRFAVLCANILAGILLLSSVLALIGQKDASVREGSSHRAQDASLIVGVLITVFIAVALFLAVKRLSQGSKPARITVWILCGLIVFCGLCGAISTGFSAAVDGIPDWYRVWDITATTVTLIGAITVAGLIATPTSNVFFAPVPAIPPSIVNPAAIHNSVSDTPD